MNIYLLSNAGCSRGKGKFFNQISAGMDPGISADFMSAIH